MKENCSMKENLQKTKLNDGVVAIKMKNEHDELAQSMFNFLVWLEENKKLVLCSAFKPQFDWYMPAFAKKERLVHEFMQEELVHPKQERMS
jgi:hypothetical protein